MIEFELNDYYYGTSDNTYLKNMYQNKKIKLKPGITILVGCNGSGKSTFIKQLENFCDGESITILSKNLEGCESDLKSRYSYHNQFDKLANIMSSSEGEILYMGIGEIMSLIGHTVSKLSLSDKKFVICIDASDSGSSIDNLIEMRYMLHLILDDLTSKNIKAYIVVSTNAYELANGEECFSVNEGKYMTFNDYEDYKQYIVKTSEWKTNRYNN